MAWARFEHAQDAAIGAAGPIGKAFAPLNASEHMIPVHGVTDGIAPNEQITVQIFAGRIRHDEAVSIAMRDQRPVS